MIQRKIGFSTGALCKIADVDAPETIRLLDRIAPGNIEIYSKDLDGMERSSLVAGEFRKFGRRSVHLIDMSDDGDFNKEMLGKAGELYAATGAELAVVHPDKVTDWAIFDGLPMVLSVENMDDREASFRRPEDMKKFFAGHDDWKMVLDLNHCFTNDPSLKLAGDFINDFHDRIAQIHLSGYAGYHEPLFKTEQSEIIECCKKLPGIPIIIESVVASADDLAREYEYVAGVLSRE
jgi:hypothetical protein